VKLALVSQSYYPRFGGVSENVGHCAAAFARGGHDVTVITGRPLHTGHAPGHADPRLPGLERVRVLRIGTGVLIPFQGAFVDVILSPTLRDDLEAMWRRERFDLVHVHQPLTPSLPLQVSLTKPAPLVGTFHAAGAPSRLLRLFHRPVSWHYHRFDARFAVSPAAARFVGDLFGDPPQVVPNGVDTARFHPAVEPAPRDGRFTVLFVGRLDPRKGLPVLLDAWPRVLRELGGDAQLIVVGSSGLAPLFRARVPAPLRKSISFAGAVSAADLPRWYAAADAFCSPATRNESFGIVLLEAMSTGKPVVCSDLPGYRAVCRPHHEGLLFPPGDADALGEALLTLARDRELASRLGETGRRRAERFDWAHVAATLEGVYEDVAAGRAPRLVEAWGDLAGAPVREDAPRAAAAVRVPAAP
jgi:phosphatidylinositol alpha-mannosyltransferase